MFSAGTSSPRPSIESTVTMTVLITSIAANSWALFDHDRPRRRTELADARVEHDEQRDAESDAHVAGPDVGQDLGEDHADQCQEDDLFDQHRDQNRSGTVVVAGSSGRCRSTSTVNGQSAAGSRERYLQYTTPAATTRPARTNHR